MNPDSTLDALMGQLVALQRRVDNLVKPEVPPASTEALAKTISLFQLIPGAVGFWPMSSVNISNGAAADLGGQGRTLTYNGNPTYNIFNDLAPYIDLDGTGDYLSRADEAGLDILGTEAHNATSVRGLTAGGWFKFDLSSGAANEILLSKRGGAGQISWQLTHRITGGNNDIVSTISVDGTATTDAINSTTLNTTDWFFVVMRFTPSTELAAFVNSSKAINTTSIPASIFNSNGPFQVGGFNGATQLPDCQASSCFLSANALPDAWINTLYSKSKALWS